MHSTEWMNQFEIKDTSIEFVINDVSWQGNKIKLKIKLNLKVEKITEIAVVIFCQINDNKHQNFV